MTAEYERPGVFYLGREYDLASGATLPRDVLYRSKDLTTHAVCVGMTGSGKTGLCLALLEEAALDGIPALVIDPKGDLGNLLLAFPELRGEDFEPWVDPGEAERKGVSVAELASSTAERWRGGLEEWGQDGARIRRFNESVDKVIYTPGSTAGVPLTVLKSFTRPGPQVMDDGEALAEHVQSVASGVLALLGETADPVTSREHILLSNVLLHAWRAGRDLDLTGLIHDVHRPPFENVGAVHVESFLSADKRTALGMKLNNLLASPSFAGWREGEPLDIQRMLYDPTGKPRLAIVSIAHLTDAERMFFVTILLNETLNWMRSQPGTSSLRALLYMDEVFGYFPPVSNPPSKGPMLTLLKQARAFGLGCVLATQNPVDLDYKGLSNAGTWLLGRLQTERDKARVIEGLQGVAAASGASFSRADLERQLSALGNRVFLLNNVHASQPTIFQTRWALSYLGGPMSRTQIARLMEGRRPAAAPEGAASGPTGDADRGAKNVRPVAPSAIRERFVAASFSDGDGPLTYRPGLVAAARLHYPPIDGGEPDCEDVMVLQPLAQREPREPIWDEAEVRDEPLTLLERLADDRAVQYDPLPAALSEPKNYDRWQRDLKDWLVRRRSRTRLKAVALNELSRPGETAEAFRQRLAPAAEQRRSAERATIEAKHKVRLERQRDAVARAEARVAEVQARFFSRLMEMLLRFLEVIFTQWSGKRSRKQVITSTSARDAMVQRQRKSTAQQKLDQELAQLADLEQSLAEELAVLDARYEPARLELQTVQETPRKTDLTVEPVALAWFPWRQAPDGAVRRAF